MQNQIKHIWMSSDTRRNSRYAVHTLGGILGITLLVLLLICGGTALMFFCGWPSQTFSLLLCLGATALAVTLALGVGRRAARDATIFFLLEGDRLFAMDARRLIPHGRTILDAAAAAAETQQFLRRIAERPCLPAGADEIRRVEQIRENRSHYALVCQVRHSNGRTARRTYFLFQGLPEQESLLHQLERRKSWESSLEKPDSQTILWFLLSALACGGSAVLCVLSHPGLALLPRELYFPCLGFSFLSLFFLIYGIIRHRRGE